ncbi:MAG: RadicalSAM domain-containing protein [Nitrospira sp.]|nr:MAG: RadicalSAM domain-containing protein [Nitrospira sp.]
MVSQVNLSHLPERYPLACQWEITCRCNLRCVMCYTDCRNTPEAVRRELATAEIISILDQLIDAGLLELCLTGGEPLARPDFFQIYDYAVSRGLLVTLFTNGTLITESVADRLAALPPRLIEISLHGASTDTFERVTQGAGSHARCLEAIRLLLARRIPLLVKTTALTLNRDEILAVKTYAASLGPAAFRLGEELRPDLDGGAGPFRYALSPHELEELNRQDPDLWSEACRKSRTDLPPCTSGMQRFHIDAYGGLQLCSGNRLQSYDLRRGSFREGFYDTLPAFACEWKAPAPAPLMQPEAHHV